MLARTGRIILWILLTPLLALGILWSAAALWIDGPAARGLAGALAAGFVVGSLGVLWWVRPLRRAVLVVVVLLAAVRAWWFVIPPRNDRDWYPDVAQTATATVDGNRLTIRNIRNFDYRSEADYTERWETRTYDLDQLRGFDMFLSFWGPTEIAHTIASWEFADGQHLAISIETRKEKGEEYSAVRGFFRQYELYYVVADERDLVRLRTNVRGEQVFLYRMRMSPDEARALLLHYLATINRLAERPRWYHALTQNCTTTIRYHMRGVALDRPWDWRLLANGHLAELAYGRGTIDTSLPFAELQRRSDITGRAKAADQDPAFSARIRDGLPGSKR